MSPRKTAKKATRAVSDSSLQIAPVDDYEERPYEPRSAEDTALAERRFDAPQSEDPNVQVEVPDITAADVERILWEQVESDVDTAALEARTQEIEDLTAPPPVILDTTTEDE